jgi:serine/threonine protein phosphatase PrpC
LIDKLGKLFKSKKPAIEPELSSHEAPTLPLAIEAQTAQEPEDLNAVQLSLLQLSASCAQSIGKRREHNEDSILTISALTTEDGDYLPIGLFIVADGMGGHNNGEVASKLAVNTVAHAILENLLLPVLDPRPAPPIAPIQEILEKSVRKAHNAISKEVPGSGTTLTIVLVIGRQMSIAHVGDTRVYHIDPSGKMDLLTRDHSLVMRMLELGQITEEEAIIHPQRNVLYRALGQGEPFTPDISTTPLPQAGHLLLCSDGLWGVVGQADIARIVQSGQSLEVACQLLVNAANDAGGPDNISAILIRIPQ